MSKIIKTIPLNRIEAVELYINECRMTMAQVRAAVDRRHDGDVHVLNGGTWSTPTKPNPHLKAGGKVLSAAGWTNWGFAWGSGPDISMRRVPNDAPNYLTCVPLLTPWDGPTAELAYNRDMGGVRGRSAIGHTGDALVLYCSQDGTVDAKSPEALRDELYRMGVESAIMLDGGGSSMCDFAGARIYGDGRKCHNYIVVWVKKESGQEPPKEEKPVDTNTRSKLVSIAKGELGVSEPKGDDKYLTWYRAATGTPLSTADNWCAAFVSWCARQAGIPLAELPNYCSCTDGMERSRAAGTWRARGSYTPQVGDVVIFQMPGTRHTGIVERLAGSTVYTIEGNSGSPGAVRSKSYPLTSTLILGYINWDKAQAEKPATGIQGVQKAMNQRYGSGLAVDGSWGPASKKAMVMAVQKEINRVYKKSLAVDGSFGPASKAAMPTVRAVHVSGLAWCIQACLTVKGYAVDLDGSYGPACAETVKSFQAASGLRATGACDAATMAALLK